MTIRPLRFSQRPIYSFSIDMRVLSKVLILVAYTVAIYLAMVSISSGTIAGCGGGSPCDKVLKSEWAYIGFIPVSIPAAIAYGLLLLAPVVESRLINRLLLGICCSIVLMVLWFVGIQIFLIGQVCPFCMTSHMFGCAGAVLYAMQLNGKPESREWTPGVVLGAAFCVGFVLLQLVLPKPDRSVEYAVETERIVEEEAATSVADEVIQKEVPGVVEVWMDDSPDSLEPLIEEQQVEDPPKPQPEPEPQPKPQPEPEPDAEVGVKKPVPIYSIHGGKFSFPVDEIPGIGNWESPNLMLNLIDFACDHCREHYRILRKRAPSYEGEIFFGVLPLALNERCNPHFSMPGLPDFSNCEYARLALAVWRMAPDKYLEYVDWLCLESSPPASLQKANWTIAKKYAEELIGAELLARGWNDVWVNEMFDTLIELYGYNLKVTGRGDIPQQFLNQKLRFGSITYESTFDMDMTMNFPIEIKKRR